MCGLVGMLTTGVTSDAEIKLFKGLLLVDQLRGEHATGVFKVDLKKNEVQTIKRASNAIDFLAEQEVKDFIEKDRVNLYVGHNRYATMGDKGKHENAHPFQHKHITMVHNGGVDPYTLDLLEGYADKGVEVDSHMVCMTIAEHGIKKAVTEKLAGAFALIWWDQNERTLNFIRNSDRPLWFAVTTSGAIVWASEKAFLDVFIERAGKYTGYRTKPVQMPADELNTFEFSETGIRKGTGPTVTPMEFLEVHYPKYQGANNSWWDRNATTTPAARAQSGNEKSTAELDNIMRINKTLEKVPCRLRFGSVITGDVDCFDVYSTNKDYGNLEVIARDPKVRVKAWGLKASELEGIKVVRGTICNAYAHVVNGVEITTIVMDKVGVSCHDAKYGAENSGHLSTSLGDQEKKQKLADDLKKIEEQKAAEKARNDKPRMRLVDGTTIFYPLKVSGHTFQNAAEFREFVSKGCSFCGKVPEAYDIKNKGLTVYEGQGFHGLLDDCEFICGKCSEA